ncbi:TadG family pilus assembly protein [Paraburkholderia mimosarum]|uniref:TadG family pilus assembly protein n=1 Tax=Paraburkholderia mimosarum TaxID=312026 RepID=UPI0039C1F0F0
MTTPAMRIHSRIRVRQPRGQRGSVALFFALFLVALLSVGMFAINIPRVAIAVNELQNDADAAALAGAAALVSGGSTGPAWTLAETAAANAVPLNRADGRDLTTGVIQAGYWNLTGTPAGMQATTITPGVYDAPSVQVTVTRARNQNGGEIALYLGSLLNLSSVPGSATAVAVVAAPSMVDSGGLFPVVMNQCIFNLYWDSATNEPEIDPSTGQPYEIEITNGQLYGGSCDAGQWTSFLTSANNVPTIRTLIANGNPSPISIGDSIWIQPGAETTVYASVPTNVTVVMPVATQIVIKTYVPIVAFAAFHIDKSVGGSGKYIQGHFVGGYTLTTGASGVGPTYGAYIAPRLAM